MRANGGVAPHDRKRFRVVYCMCNKFYQRRNCKMTRKNNKHENKTKRVGNAIKLI